MDLGLEPKLACTNEYTDIEFMVSLFLGPLRTHMCTSRSFEKPTASANMMPTTSWRFPCTNSVSSFSAIFDVGEASGLALTSRSSNGSMFIALALRRVRIRFFCNCSLCVRPATRRSESADARPLLIDSGALFTHLSPSELTSSST